MLIDAPIRDCPSGLVHELELPRADYLFCAGPFACSSHASPKEPTDEPGEQRGQYKK
jgi:hypothetical protein